jgi:DNA-binding transcriptional MerR regulator
MIMPTVTVWSTMKIGKLAKSVDCHVETVRYYEKQGLLPPANKSANGYGEYSDNHLQLLRLIRHAKGLGFSQPQVRQLVRLATKGEDACDDVLSLTREQMGVVDWKLQELSRMKKALIRLSRACEENRDNDCPLLEELIIK